MNIKQSPNINALWGRLIVEELLRNGVDTFCMAPGSRSSPLVVAVAQNKKAKSVIHYDERGLAFYALGYTSATGKPSVLITTSGTAVANLLPAVIEASKKKLPLIVLTADRPPELRKTGANQTIDQPGIFSGYVRTCVDMPAPTGQINPEYVLTTIDQAVYQSRTPLPGPVHLNCMFREPLDPVKTRDFTQRYFKNIESWLQAVKPYTSYIGYDKQLSQPALSDIAAAVNRIKNGVIVVGKLSSEKQRQGVLRLSKKLKWPVFPDVTSGLRSGYSSETVIHYYDQLLVSENCRSKLRFDGVIHIGGRISSQRWYDFIDATRPKEYIMILNHQLRNDPLHNITLRVESPIEKFCASILPKIKARKGGAQLKRLQKYSAHMDMEMNIFFKKSGLLDEPDVFRLISHIKPQDSGIFLSSSLPVREMDMYAKNNGRLTQIGSNRGASGIDGTIASAAGYACGLNKTVTLLIGDLAFLHDLNSLSLVKNCKNPFIIVVVNNNGGGIFSFLPIARYGDVFEKFFGTPQNTNFEKAAELFHIDYARPVNPYQLTHEYTSALKKKKSIIIEVQTERGKNYELQKRWRRRVAKILK